MGQLEEWCAIIPRLQALPAGWSYPHALLGHLRLLGVGTANELAHVAPNKDSPICLVTGPPALSQTCKQTCNNARTTTRARLARDRPGSVEGPFHSWQTFRCMPRYQPARAHPDAGRLHVLDDDARCAAARLAQDQADGHHGAVGERSKGGVAPRLPGMVVGW